MRSALFICLAVVAALVAYIYIPQIQSKPISLRLAINPFPGYALLHVAKDEGFFAEAGIDIELIEISDLYGVSRSFERGKVDAMTSTMVEVADVYQRSGKAAVPILFTDYSDGADVVISVSDKVNSLIDLEGKTIAVEPASLGYYMLRRALETAGLEEKDVKISVMPQNAMKAALKRGAVDALVTYPPISGEVKSEFPTSKIVFDSSSLPGEILDVVSVDRGYLKKNPEIVSRLSKVWAKSLDFYNAHPDRAIPLMAIKSDIPEVDLREDLKKIHFFTPKEAAKMNETKSQIIVLSKVISYLYGDLKFNAEKFVYDSYVK